MNLEEDFRDIPGYEGLYQVSNLGRVKGLYKNIIKRLKTTKDGYLEVGLSKNGIEKKYRVHRLVAITFIPNPDNLPEVNHLDENKTNNCVSNLEWCTHKQNINYGTHHDRMVKTQSKPVLQFDKEGGFIKEWSSIAQISRELNINTGSVSNCCNGKAKTASGFIFKFKHYELF